MVETGNFTKGAEAAYNGILSSLPKGVASGMNVMLFALLIAFICLFVWKFYKSLSKKDLIELRLSRFNNSGSRFNAVLFYSIENIVLNPLFIIIGFVCLSVLMLTAVPLADMNQMLVLAASVLTAIRILAYHNHEISRDLAKLFPFAIFFVFISAPSALTVRSILGPLEKAPALLNSILPFVIVIFAVEAVLRIFDTMTEPRQAVEAPKGAKTAEEAKPAKEKKEQK